MESTLGAQGRSILTILLHCGRSHTPCFYSSRPFLLRDVLNFLQIMLEIKFFMNVGQEKELVLTKKDITSVRFSGLDALPVIR